MLFSTLCIAASRSYDGLAVGELLCFDAVRLVAKSAVVHGKVIAIDRLRADFVSANNYHSTARRQPMNCFRVFHFIPSLGSITSMWGKCFGD